MEDQKHQKPSSFYPLQNQLSILKQKLDQRGYLIRNLLSQIQRQKRVTLSVIEQFQVHEANILTKLRKLQQVNIKYIKDYLLVKRQMQVQDFGGVSRSIVNVGVDNYFANKCKEIKENLQGQVKRKGEMGVGGGKDNNFVGGCVQLIKRFLASRQQQYNKKIADLCEERKGKLKGVKGLDGFKKNKQQEKVLQQLRVKVKLFNKKLASPDNFNIIELFNSKNQIEMKMQGLSPGRQIITEQDSEEEKKMLQKIVEKIILMNFQKGSVQEQISQQFLQGQFQSFQNSICEGINRYGDSIFVEGVQKIEDLSIEMKRQVLEGRGGYRHMVLNSQKQRIGSQKFLYIEEEKMKKMSSNNSFQAKSKRQIHEEMKRQGQLLSKQQIQIIDPQDSFDELQIRRNQRSNTSQNTNRINAAYETSVNKSFFKEQQIARDKLIARQNSQIQEHEKIIFKLVAFIKKEFKDSRMEDIDGDDPEQLMGYYFRLNEKKYVDIKVQMKELEVEKIKVQEEVFQLREGRIQLEREQKEYQQENLELRKDVRVLEEEKEEIRLEKERIFDRTLVLEEQIRKMGQSMQKEKQKNQMAYYQNQNLRLKLQLQKLQILALSQIYEGIKTSTQQYHNITTRTQNIVKLSLETLFNECLSKLTPEELIVRLEKIIQLIRVNMKLKSDLIFELDIQDYISQEEAKVKKGFYLKVQEDILPRANNSANQFTFVKNGEGNQKRDKTKEREIDISGEIQQNQNVLAKSFCFSKGKDKDKGHQNVEKSEKSKSFADDLEDLACKMIEKSQKNEPIQELMELGQIQQKKKAQKKKKQKIISDTPAYLIPLLSLLQKPKNTDSSSEQENEQKQQEHYEFQPASLQSSINRSQQKDEKAQSKGLDQSFLEGMIEKIRQMKEVRYSQDEDLKQMYEKYKQALNCLQRAQRINKETQVKYQQFLYDLKQKGAKNSPQALQNKLFYMQNIISAQNELLESQRKQFEGTILKQVQKSQKLAEDVVKSLKMRRKNNAK